MKKPTKCLECEHCYELEDDNEKLIGHICFSNLEKIENVETIPEWCPEDYNYGNENE